MEQLNAMGVPVTLIHYVHQDDSGRWRITCMPNMDSSEFGETAYHKSILRTDDIRAVTCSACKNSQRKGLK